MYPGYIFDLSIFTFESLSEKNTSGTEILTNCALLKEDEGYYQLKLVLFGGEQGIF